MDNEMTTTSGGCGAVAPAAEVTKSAASFRANLDVLETDDEFLVLADVPGSTSDQIDINFEDGTLSVCAGVKARRATGFKRLIQEYGVGEFVRSLRLGEGIDSAKISAELKDGVLTLRLPKAETAKPRTIKVQMAS